VVLAGAFQHPPQFLVAEDRVAVERHHRNADRIPLDDVVYGVDPAAELRLDHLKIDLHELQALIALQHQDQDLDVLVESLSVHRLVDLDLLLEQSEALEEVFDFHLVGAGDLDLPQQRELLDLHHHDDAALAPFLPAHHQVLEPCGVEQRHVVELSGRGIEGSPHTRRKIEANRVVVEPIVADDVDLFDVPAVSRGDFLCTHSTRRERRHQQQQYEHDRGQAGGVIRALIAMSGRHEFVCAGGAETIAPTRWIEGTQWPDHTASGPPAVGGRTARPCPRPQRRPALGAARSRARSAAGHRRR